jgi:hypothetical protein
MQQQPAGWAGVRHACGKEANMFDLFLFGLDWAGVSKAKHCDLGSEPAL